MDPKTMSLDMGQTSAAHAAASCGNLQSAGSNVRSTARQRNSQPGHRTDTIMASHYAQKSNLLHMGLVVIWLLTC